MRPGVSRREPPRSPARSAIGGAWLSMLQPLGPASMGLGNVRQRAAIWRRRSRWRRAGEKREIAAALNLLAHLHRMGGALGAPSLLRAGSGARARSGRSREHCDRPPQPRDGVDRARRRRSLRREMLRGALAIAEEIGSKRESQSVLEVSAGLAGLRGEWPQVARFFGAAEAQAAETGLRRDPADEALPRSVGRESSQDARPGRIRCGRSGRSRALVYRSECRGARVATQCPLMMTGSRGGQSGPPLEHYPSLNFNPIGIFVLSGQAVLVVQLELLAVRLHFGPIELAARGFERNALVVEGIDKTATSNSIPRRCCFPP